MSNSSDDVDLDRIDPRAQRYLDAYLTRRGRFTVKVLWAWFVGNLVILGGILTILWAALETVARDKVHAAIDEALSVRSTAFKKLDETLSTALTNAGHRTAEADALAQVMHRAREKIMSAVPEARLEELTKGAEMIAAAMKSAPDAKKIIETMVSMEKLVADARLSVRTTDLWIQGRAYADDASSRPGPRLLAGALSSSTHEWKLQELAENSTVLAAWWVPSDGFETLTQIHSLTTSRSGDNVQITANSGPSSDFVFKITVFALVGRPAP